MEFSRGRRGAKRRAGRRLERVVRRQAYLAILLHDSCTAPDVEVRMQFAIHLPCPPSHMMAFRRPAIRSPTMLAFRAKPNTPANAASAVTGQYGNGGSDANASQTILPRTCTTTNEKTPQSVLSQTVASSSGF